MFNCETCGKAFKYRSSLSRHKNGSQSDRLKPSCHPTPMVTSAQKQKDLFLADRLWNWMISHGMLPGMVQQVT